MGCGAGNAVALFTAYLIVILSKSMAEDFTRKYAKYQVRNRVIEGSEKKISIPRAEHQVRE